MSIFTDHEGDESCAHGYPWHYRREAHLNIIVGSTLPFLRLPEMPKTQGPPITNFPLLHYLYLALPAKCVSAVVHSCAIAVLVLIWLFFCPRALRCLHSLKRARPSPSCPAKQQTPDSLRLIPPRLGTTSNSSLGKSPAMMCDMR